MYRLLTKLVFTSLLCVIGLTAFAGSASASRSLSLNPAGNITATSQGLLSLRTTVVGTPITVQCLVTLTGSLSRSIPKVANTDMGSVFGATVRDPCNGPVLGQFPRAIPLVGTNNQWRLRYVSFAGRLPNPTLVTFNVINAQFLVDIPNVARCLWAGNVPAQLAFSGSSPNTSGLIRILPHNVPLLTDLLPPNCGGNPGQLVGGFTLTPRQTLILVN